MSAPSKLKRASLYNNTPEPTLEFDPLSPEHVRMKEDKKREAKSRDEEQSSSVKASLAYYCGNCGYTVQDVIAAENPCANCGGEMVLTTL
jgi:rubrerythrin